MANMTSLTPAATFESILKIGTGNNQKLDTTLRVVEDGTGQASALYLATDSVMVEGTNKLYFGDADGDEYIYGDNTDLRIYSGADVLLLPTGNVGIGTTSPDALLHISSGTSGDCTVIIEADTDNNAEDDIPKLVLISDGGGGHAIFGKNGDAGTEYTDALANCLYLQSFDNAPAESSIQFVTGGDKDAPTAGTARMTIDQNGNVGIGTTLPATLLELEASAPVLTLDATGSNATLRLDAYATSHNSVLEFYQGGAAQGSINFAHNSTAAQEELKFFLGGASNRVMTILGSGNVGIGTAAPAYQLDIGKSDGGALSMSRGVSGADVAIADGGALGTIYFTGYDADHSAVQVGAMIRGEAAEAWDTDNVNRAPSELQFFTNDDSDTSTISSPRMTIDRDGNVGIGAVAGSNGTFYVTNATSDVNGSRVYLSNTGYTVSATHVAVNTTAGTGFKLHSGDAAGPVRQFDVDGTGTIRAESSPVGTVDYAEFFESTDGKEISLGTTVVLDNGKVRKAVEGEMPFGVVSSTEGNGGASHNWHKRYLKGEYNEPIYESDGTTLKENPDYAPEGYDEEGYAIYTPRRDRDEWNSIGLLGQIPITKGEVIPSSWIKMWEVSDTVDMYFIK